MEELLDQTWCNKDYLYTLYVPPPSKNSGGEFTMGSKEDWIERVNLFIGDLSSLLQMQYHRFWSEVMFNRHVLDGLNSFFQNAFPFYLRDIIPQDKEITQKLKKCQKLVFLVLLRLTTTKESEKAWMKSSTLSTILYDNFIISLPQIMDICLIYGQDNIKEVSFLINKIIDIQPKYIDDVEKSIPFICEVFTKLENQLNSINQVNGYISVVENHRESISSVETVKLIFLVLDISYALATLLQICTQVGAIFHEQHLETRIASFYENIVPELTKLLDSQYNNEDTQEEFSKYQLKVNLSRHQLIVAVHGCLASYMSSILEDRYLIDTQELKTKVENYLNTICDCISYHVFIHDYNSAFPIQRELKMLSDIYPDIDSVKCDYIVESVLSLYDLPSKPQQCLVTPPSQEEASSSNSSANSQLTNSRKISDTKVTVTGVELDSLITEVKDILPHLGDGFIVKCLELYNFVSADVVNAILVEALPDSLSSLDFETPVIPPEYIENPNALPERINVFDNDEFDIMTQSEIDRSRVHRGKRQEKHKDLFEMLDDKSHVNQLRDVYAQLGLVESVENVNEYEDEYDDTYDDVDVPVGNEGETETEERRPFVIPRVLQQRKKSFEDETQEFQEEDDDENEVKADLFIENPADIRERAEQRRMEMRGRGSGRSRGSFPRHDVVGKPRGQGQDKTVVVSREFKNTHKASRGNHNRRSMADKKRRQGMFPS